MPRNSAGTYTLPSGNPVSAGTLIEASWANTTLSDLASAMTNSLSRGGEGGMTAALRLFDGTVSLPGLAFTSETSSGLYRAGAGDMRLAITGSQVVQFLSTGVAVTGTLSASGAATLSSTLAVTGASTFSGQTNTFENSTAYYPQLINRNKTNDANGSYFVLEKVRNTSAVQSGDVLGNLIYRGYDGTQYLQGAYINAIVSATPGTNDMPTDLSFGTTPDGGAGPTERMRITQAGLVGIGQAIPAYALDIGTSTANIRIAPGTATNNALVRFGNNGGSAYVGLDANSAGLGGQYSLNLWHSGAYPIVFGTSDTARMRIDSSGNVGIGTSSPNQKLVVAGGRSVFRANSDLFSIQVEGASGAGQYYIGATNEASPSLVFSNVGGTERARIDSSGNLLVGATASANSTYSIATFRGASKGIAIQDSGSGAYRAIYIGGGNNLYFYNGTNEGYLSSAGAWTNASDARLKTNVRNIEYGLATVLETQPRHYERVDVEGTYIGFVAQELQEVIPEVVSGDPEKQLGVDYGSLVAVAFKAIQEMKAIIDAQASTITTLTDRITALEAAP